MTNHSFFGIAVDICGNFEHCVSYQSLGVSSLCKPVNIEKLLGYITADDLDEAKKFK